MLNEIIKNLPIPTWGLLLLIGGVLLWKLFQFVEETNRRNKKWDDLLTSHSQFVESHNKLIASHNNLFDRFDRLIFELRGLFGFGTTHSPIRLKDEWKKPVEDSSIKQQIEQKLDQFVADIQSQNPPTPLDAQMYIDRKVKSWIATLDLNDFKTKLYEAGGTNIAIELVLSLYLQELIIPKLKF